MECSSYTHIVGAFSCCLAFLRTPFIKERVAWPLGQALGKVLVDKVVVYQRIPCLMKIEEGLEPKVAAIGR